MSTIDFPGSPSVNDTYTFNGRTWKWNGAAWETVSLPDVGYRYAETVYFSSSGTFSKATYPWLRAMRVRVVGAGGGGGGAGTTGASQVANSQGGGGASYAESRITDIAGLDASVTVTVGAGGDGGSAGANAGNAGGTSSFGALVVADGGGGGATYAAAGNTNVLISPLVTTSGTGDLVVPSTPSALGFSALGGSFEQFRSASGGGGHSVLGAGGRPRTPNADGIAGTGKGSGGGGGLNAENQATARSGGNGTAGIVILELFA